MPKSKPRPFTVGVFGIIGKKHNHEVYILVNVRTDQEKQIKWANLSKDFPCAIVDLPGGHVEDADTNLREALLREISEETGCDKNRIKILTAPIKIFELITGELNDLAIAYCVTISGQTKPTNEALQHLWVSRKNLENGIVRFPGKLGKGGRMWNMAMAGIDYFEKQWGYA